MAEIFKFKEQQVRVLGSADKPWWVGKDICDVLGDFQERIYHLLKGKTNAA